MSMSIIATQFDAVDAGDATYATDWVNVDSFTRLSAQMAGTLSIGVIELQGRLIDPGTGEGLVDRASGDPVSFVVQSGGSDVVLNSSIDHVLSVDVSGIDQVRWKVRTAEGSSAFVDIVMRLDDRASAS